MALNGDRPEAERADSGGSSVEILDQARRLVREQTPDGWPKASAKIRRRLRSIAVPAQTFAAYVEPGSRGSHVSVTSRVLLPALRSGVDSEQRVADDITLDPATLADRRRRLSGVRVDLVCRYGADLQQEGAEVRRAVGEVVAEVLGDDPGFDAGRDVQVRIVGVVEGDPRQG